MKAPRIILPRLSHSPINRALQFGAMSHPIFFAQEGVTYRDIPQTTYTSLISSGAGEATPTPAQARGRKGKAEKDKAGRLEPRDACEAMMYSLPAGLRETLLPFQRDGVLYGLRRRGRCLIADEMGTGKVRGSPSLSMRPCCPISCATCGP